MATPKGGYTQGGQTILRTKLAVPRPRSDRVARPRLESLLERGAEKGLTIVRSPAGFGKTTLVSGWLERSNRHVGWVSLDEQDSAPVRFWSYVASAINLSAPGAGSEALLMLAARQPPDLETIVAELLNSLSTIDFELVLVLDDYHLITEPVVHRSLGYLLSHAPRNLSVIICTREEPPLGLPALRAGSSLVELTADSLRFSDDEIGAFFRMTVKIPLEEAALGTLERVTEGWAAALQLAALTLEGAADPMQVIGGFSGRNEYLFDYLAEEVFARLDVTLQSLLIDTAFLDRFCLPLCERLTGNALPPDRLELLERQNLFLISLDDERMWYRYHRLFREFLQAQARRLRTEAQINEKLVVAAGWFRSNSIAGEAVAYAFAASQFELAADIISEHSGSLFANSDLITLRDWVDRLPQEVLAKRPPLAFMYAWALLATGRGADVEAIIELIENALDIRSTAPAGPRPGSARLLCALAELSVLRSSLAFVRFDMEEIERETRRALDYLPDEVDDTVFNAPRDIRATALFNLALAYEFRGQVEPAVATFEDALQANTETENIHLIPMIIAHLGNLQVVQGKLTAAEALYRRVVDGTGTIGHSPLAGLAYVGLGWILLEKNLIEEGMKLLSAGVEMGRRWANWEELLPGMLGLVRGENAVGNTVRALDILEELSQTAIDLKLPETARSSVEANIVLSRLRMGSDPEEARSQAGAALEAMGDISFMGETEAMVWCNVLVESGGSLAACRLLERIERNIREGGRTGRLVQVLALEAVALAVLDREDDARTRLREAVDLAEAEGYIRVFLDLGTPMVRLLESMTEVGTARKRLLEALRGGERAMVTVGTAISRRELEVLRSVAAGESNQEIADGLFVSLNTVKTHLKNIFAKLDVSSRAQAVARARELGLLAGEQGR